MRPPWRATGAFVLRIRKWNQPASPARGSRSNAVCARAEARLSDQRSSHNRIRSIRQLLNLASICEEQMSFPFKRTFCVQRQVLLGTAS